MAEHLQTSKLLEFKNNYYQMAHFFTPDEVRIADWQPSRLQRYCNGS
jgi:hypothetical protein